MICNRRRESDPVMVGREDSRAVGVGRGLREPGSTLKPSTRGTHKLNIKSEVLAVPVTSCETWSQYFTSLSLAFPICKMGNKNRTYLLGLWEGFREASC